MTMPQGLTSLIGASVGTPGRARNVPADVQCIQYLFNLIAPKTALPLAENGQGDAQLALRISHYQLNQLKFAQPDGVIDPGGRTFNRLVEDALKAVPGVQGSDVIRVRVNQYLVRARALLEAEQRRQLLVTQPTCDGGVALTDADFQRAAAALGNGISVNVIKAFATVESGGRSGFGPAYMPVIAFEGHIFRKYTQQKYDKTHPFLSYPYLIKAGPQWRANNKDQTKAWQTLAAAFDLDPTAALMAASWGMFQVMGFNFVACGYGTVFEFVAAMKINAGQQLMAFVAFCRRNPALVKAMKNKDYVGMARNYNGKDYGNYDVLMQKAYEKFEGKK